jgi:hypothetical protein
VIVVGIDQYGERVASIEEGVAPPLVPIDPRGVGIAKVGADIEVVLVVGDPDERFRGGGETGERLLGNKSAGRFGRSPRRLIEEAVDREGPLLEGEGGEGTLGLLLRLGVGGEEREGE